MRVNEQCKVLCRIESLSAAQTKAFKDKIDDDYKVNMCVRPALMLRLPLRLPGPRGRPARDSSSFSLSLSAS
jgi:hypothetical protein